ncbi:DUF2905 domain-containing protein [Deferribacteraceae bacterium V6Fe1]|nr:DUF2905 domain-containing protein [Deferribacteraceae bacterium V6Fe1]
MNPGIGRMLILLGIIFIIAGFIFITGEKIGLGRLFGDIYYKKGNFSFYFPITTSIIISIILTILLNIFFRK